MASSTAPISTDGYGTTIPITEGINRVRIAHGAIMAVVFLLLKPAGAILLRTLGGRLAFRVHVWWQTFAWILALGGVSMGIWLTDVLERYGFTHPTVGFVVAGLFVLQPILGWIHHLIFLRVHHSTWWGFAHVWNGRLVLLLGIINGGLGLQAADNTIKGEWAYGVFAVVSFLSYAGILAAVAYKKRHMSQEGTVKDQPNGSQIIQLEQVT